jgi:hypothetical protein
MKTSPFSTMMGEVNNPPVPWRENGDEGSTEAA